MVIVWQHNPKTNTVIIFNTKLGVAKLRIVTNALIKAVFNLVFTSRAKHTVRLCRYLAIIVAYLTFDFGWML